MRNVVFCSMKNIIEEGRYKNNEQKINYIKNKGRQVFGKMIDNNCIFF